eukprot:227379-Rhodomonas_salina.1
MQLVRPFSRILSCQQNHATHSISTSRPTRHWWTLVSLTGPTSLSARIRGSRGCRGMIRTEWSAFSHPPHPSHPLPLPPCVLVLVMLTDHPSTAYRGPTASTPSYSL